MKNAEQMSYVDEEHFSGGLSGHQLTVCVCVCLRACSRRPVSTHSVQSDGASPLQRPCGRTNPGQAHQRQPTRATKPADSTASTQPMAPNTPHKVKTTRPKVAKLQWNKPARSDHKDDDVQDKATRRKPPSAEDKDKDKHLQN